MFTHRASALVLSLAWALGLCVTASTARAVVLEAVPAAALAAFAAQENAAQSDGKWRLKATTADRLRIRDWFKSWKKALADARAQGSGERIASEEVLLEPLAALPNPRIPVGLYRCRTLKIGGQPKAQSGAQGYRTSDWFRCRISLEQGVYSFAMVSGVQRPTGRIFADTKHRQIFLGTLMLGHEVVPLAYGSDPIRDMAGLVERVGDQRWRLVFPAPTFGALLDVIELLPAE